MTAHTALQGDETTSPAPGANTTSAPTAGTHQGDVLQGTGSQQQSSQHLHYHYSITGKLQIKDGPQLEAVQKEGLKRIQMAKILIQNKNKNISPVATSP